MRLRLILSYVILILATVIGVVWFARQGAAREVRSFMLRGGMMDTDDLLQTLAEYYSQSGSWTGVESVLARPRQGYGMGPGGAGRMMMNGQRLRLADADGEVVSDTSDRPPYSVLTSNELASALPIQVSGRTVGYLVAEGGMGYNRADEEFLLSRITQAAVFAGLIATALSLVLATLFADRLVRPIRNLIAAAGHLGAGDLNQRVPVSGEDELAIMGRAFNRMASSLQAAEDGRRALTADIAHELRTPLAVQRAHLEAMQDGVYALTAENLQSVIDQNRTLTHLVDDLRTLALADSGQLNLERIPTDLRALALQAVERFQPEAAARRVNLHCEERLEELSAEPAGLPADRLKLDPLRIEQILTNLLTNALRHTPAGGRIWVGVREKADSVQLFVQDTGPGIPEDALPHIFDRFYRADRSRSRDEGGAGLGLAIARRLAEAHGGTLTAANSPTGGAVFMLSLPIRPNPVP